MEATAGLVLRLRISGEHGVSGVRCLLQLLPGYPLFSTAVNPTEGKESREDSAVGWQRLCFFII